LLARALQLPCAEASEGARFLAKAAGILKKELGMPSSLRELGVEKAHFTAIAGLIAENALKDACMADDPTRNRQELESFLLRFYAGRNVM
jgi:alcohol dehydrogenase class IV